MNYNLQYHPWDALDLGLSVTDLWSFFQGREAQENASVLTQLHGSLLPALNLSSEVGFNRNLQLESDKEFETWNYQLSLDGDVFKKLGAMMTYAYRTSRETHSGMRIAQNRFSGNLTLRLTQTILITGETDVLEDGAISVNQEYNLNWHIVPKVSFGAQSAFTSRQNGVGTERYAYYLNYEFARNGTMYCQINKYDAWTAGGDKSLSAMVGVHTGF